MVQSFGLGGTCPSRVGDEDRMAQRREDLSVVGPKRVSGRTALADAPPRALVPMRRFMDLVPSRSEMPGRRVAAKRHPRIIAAKQPVLARVDCHPCYALPMSADSERRWTRPRSLNLRDETPRLKMGSACHRSRVGPTDRVLTVSHKRCRRTKEGR
jgi:hypothetical protein